MQLASILPLEAVLPHLVARDKKQIIKALASQAAKLSGLPEKAVFSVLMEREQLGCTGVGNGVCIPHGRFPNLEHVHAVFARLDKPVSFGSADGKPVDLVMLLLTPSSANTDHIKALATISRVLRDRSLCDQLRKTEDIKVMHTLLLATDANDRDNTSH
jgi:nitrogen PTS system EIIA component